MFKNEYLCWSDALKLAGHVSETGNGKTEGADIGRLGMDFWRFDFFGFNVLLHSIFRQRGKRSFSDSDRISSAHPRTSSCHTGRA